MGFLSRVKNVVKDADVILEVVDARFDDLTRNRNFEKEAVQRGKKLIIVANKADLVQNQNYRCEFPVVWISSLKRLGSRRLRAAIGIASGKKKVKVAVVGYPNTGKSSLINMLRGKKVARSSISAGFTKGEQIVKISEDISLIDLPGIIPMDEMDEAELALIAAKSPWQLKDVLAAAEKLIALLQSNGRKELMGISIAGKDPGEAIEELAVEKKRVRKGNVPDVDAMSKIILLEWQKGKL